MSMIALDGLAVLFPPFSRASSSFSCFSSAACCSFSLFSSSLACFLYCFGTYCSQLLLFCEWEFQLDSSPRCCLGTHLFHEPVANIVPLAEFAVAFEKFPPH